ncbi:MAG TPA: AsmA family protein [Candidatus Acidoferrum sp.]
MNRARKYTKYIVGVLALLIAVQVGVSFLVKTRRTRNYLQTHLQAAFGRPVEAGEFSVRILPVPRLDVDGVTVAEDPAFGQEYFLRAEHMAANLRWTGLLRGRFEFGTMSLTRPSLILVRRDDGRWNLEQWLPPAKRNPEADAGNYGPRQPAESHHLRKIEFDDGRINFKQGDDKRPFAFTSVSGSVEQVDAGRWSLQLEAQPWRSGVVLQSTGTIQVRGDVAGTSARLQPAQIQVHWEGASVADLFRLATGNDSGVRGDFSLDGKASIAKAAPGDTSETRQWKFEVRARAGQIHRWDLTERNDNPRFSVGLTGRWDAAAGEIQADEIGVDLPNSHARGTGVLRTSVPASWNVKAESVEMDARDALAWYRAFHADVAEGLAVEQFFSGDFAVGGWPLTWEDGRITSRGGVMRVPGLSHPVLVSSVRGQVRAGKFAIEPVRLTMSAAAAASVEKSATRTREAGEPPTSAELRMAGNLGEGKCAVLVNWQFGKTEDFFQAASAWGHTFRHGWDLTGAASGKAEWNWQRGSDKPQWSGSVHLERSQLQAAGLNLPLKLDDVRVEWKDGRRTATVARAEAFGATWNGTIENEPAVSSEEEGQWTFQLHADHLDAADFDRWFGPRSRPNWLQRLLPSLLGTGTSGGSGKASELLRRVSTHGEVSADTVTVEKVRLTQARARLDMHDLRLEVRDAEAQWAGGSLRGEMTAAFSPTPKYDVTAEVEKVNLGQLPWPSRWGGAASGKLHLTTGGVGREELLKQLAGHGEVHLKNIEFRGWDVAASAEAGAARAGLSRWTGGGGEFAVKDSAVTFDDLALEGARTTTRLSGTLQFSQEASLSFSPSEGKRKPKSLSPARIFEVSGPLDAPKVEVTPVQESPARP